MYIVAIRLDGDITSLSPDEFFDQLGDLLKVMQIEPLPVEAVLLKDSDVTLQQELHRRLEHRRAQDAKAEEEGFDAPQDIVLVALHQCQRY